jgi:hypothetical protein
MKFIITESELNRFIVNYMNYMYHPDDLEVVYSDDFPQSTFYKKNGVLVMEEDWDVPDHELMYFWFDYGEIWSYFLEYYNFTDSEIKKGLRVWLEETMGVTDVDIAFYNVTTDRFP